MTQMLSGYCVKRDRGVNGTVLSLLINAVGGRRWIFGDLGDGADELQLPVDDQGAAPAQNC